MIYFTCSFPDYLLLTMYKFLPFVELLEKWSISLQMLITKSKGYFCEIDNCKLHKWQNILHLMLLTRVGIGSIVWCFPHSFVLHVRTSLHRCKNNLSFINYILITMQIMAKYVIFCTKHMMIWDCFKVFSMSWGRWQ